MRRVTAGRRATADKDRMHFRLDPEIRERIARAAAISGQALTAFAVAALSERADEILARHDSVLLSRRDYQFFMDALDTPKAPSRRAQTAADRYRRGRREGVSFRLAD